MVRPGLLAPDLPVFPDVQPLTVPVYHVFLCVYPKDVFKLNKCIWQFNPTYREFALCPEWNQMNIIIFKSIQNIIQFYVSIEQNGANYLETN